MRTSHTYKKPGSTISTMSCHSQSCRSDTTIGTRKSFAQLHGEQTLYDRHRNQGLCDADCNVQSFDSTVGKVRVSLPAEVCQRPNPHAMWKLSAHKCVDSGCAKTVHVLVSLPKKFHQNLSGYRRRYASFGSNVVVQGVVMGESGS